METKTAREAPAGSETVEEAPVRPRAAGDAPAERRCLSCDTLFVSEGWHNRLCRRCARSNGTPGTYAAHGASRGGRRGAG